MILKSLSRKSNPSQLIGYVLRYSLKENKQAEHKEDATLILRHNLRSRSVQGYIKEFLSNEAFRIYKRKDSVVLFHTILSFAPEDKEHITEAQLKNIAKQYVSLRGNNSLYLVVAHKEKLHTHLHMVNSGVQLNGYSSRVSKQQFKHIKLELEKFVQEKYPELSASAIIHDKSKQLSKAALIEQVQNTRQTAKQKLLTVLNEAYTSATSKEDFLNKLQEQSYEPYYRKTNLQGLIADGRKYRFTRIGYDAETIEQLDTRWSVLEKPLQELQQLRFGKQRELQKEIKQEYSKATPMQEPAIQTELSELSALRTMHRSKQKDGYDYERELVSEAVSLQDISSTGSASDVENEISMPLSLPFIKPAFMYDEQE